MQFINGETGLRYENRQRCVVMGDGGGVVRELDGPGSVSIILDI